MEFKGTIYDFSNSKQYRGCWLKLFTDAVWADREGDVKAKAYFLKQLRRLQEFFPCHECQQHFGEYLVEHAPELSVFESNHSCFDYIYQFHNAVSARIGQPLRDYNVLRMLFHYPQSYREIINTKGGYYDFGLDSKLRGCWMKMLDDALTIDNEEERLMFCGQLRQLQQFFPREDYRENMAAYYTKQPPELAKNLFNYVVEHLNGTLQQQRRSERYDARLLRQLFSVPGMNTCHGNCGSTDLARQSNSSKSPPPPSKVRITSTVGK